MYIYIYIYIPQNFCLDGGRPSPCSYDFKWSEITSRGDWRPEPLLLRYQMKWNNNKGRPNVCGIHLNDDPFWRKHRIPLPSSRCCYKAFWNILEIIYFEKGEVLCFLRKGLSLRWMSPTCFILPLLLFHFVWNHNSKGLVSPSSRTKVLWEYHFFVFSF